MQGIQTFVVTGRPTAETFHCIFYFVFCTLHFAFCILYFAFCILYFAFVFFLQQMQTFVVTAETFICKDFDRALEGYDGTPACIFNTLQNCAKQEIAEITNFKKL